MTRDEFADKVKASPFSAMGDLVYQYLQEAIVSLSIKPGTSLNESRLAEQLGLSRTPIHSALVRLEADGLVQLRHGKNPVVTPLDISEYYCIADFRSAIEGKAASRAALLISQEDLAQLKKIVIDIELRENSTVPYPLNDTRFHEIILRATRNPYFQKAYEVYHVKLMRYRWFIFQNVPNSSFDLSSRESVHRGLYLALKNRFPQQAEELAELDATMMRDTVLKF